MSRFEKFATEQDVMERIEQLRAEGFEEADITVISSQKLESAYLKYTSVNFKNSEGTTWDKFVSMFSDDDPKDKVLGAFDITDSEKEHFKYALYKEEILLLKEGHAVNDERYVQEEPREYHETQQQDMQAMETEAEQNERLDARNTATEASVRNRTDDPYEDEPEDAVRHASVRGSKGVDIEDDNDITLKDTENEEKKNDAPLKDEYDYNSRQEYDYK